MVKDAAKRFVAKTLEGFSYKNLKVEVNQETRELDISFDLQLPPVYEISFILDDHPQECICIGPPAQNCPKHGSVTITIPGV